MTGAATGPKTAGSQHFVRWLGCADAISAVSFPSWLAEAALAHAVGSKVEAAYKRGAAETKRRKLMEAWARYCGGSPTQEDATPLAAE